MSSVRAAVENMPVGTWVRPSQFGGTNTADQALRRLAQDPDGQLVRAAKGLYFKCGPATEFFGKQQPSALAVALEVARGRGVGPAGPVAAAALGLTTQVLPRPVLVVVGDAPSGVDGVTWQSRANTARVQLNYAEIAVLELLSVYPSGAEASWADVVARITALQGTSQIDLDRIVDVAQSERRKPVLRRSLAFVQALVEPERPQAKVLMGDEETFAPSEPTPARRRSTVGTVHR
jgi:hypothetical protein